MVYVSRSRLGRGSLTNFSIIFGIQNRRSGGHFRSEKNIQKWVRLPPPKRDLVTQTTYGLQTWQRGIYVQWSIHPPSLVMVRGLLGQDSWRQSSVVCEKHAFSLLWNRTREPRALDAFQHHKRENQFCFLSSGTIIVGLTIIIVPGNKTGLLTLWQVFSPGDVKKYSMSYWSIFERNLVGLAAFGSKFQRMANWPSFDF